MTDAKAANTALIEAETDRLLNEAFAGMPDQPAPQGADNQPPGEFLLTDRDFGPDDLKLIDLGVERPERPLLETQPPLQTDRPDQIHFDILATKGSDIERLVRVGLSEHVMMCPFLPSAIARALANEVNAMAMPIVRYADVLSGDDLEAIAAIPLQNDNGKVIDHDSLKLPLTVSAHLIFQLTDAVCERLVDCHLLPAEMADEMKLHGRERAFTQVMAADYRASEFECLAGRLHGENILTPTLILRTLFIGNLDFFLAAMAARAGVSIAEAGLMIFSKGREGLEQIYRQAELPSEFFIALSRAVEVLRDLSHERRSVRGLEITERIMVRLRMEYDNVCPEGLEHTLSQLSHFVLGRSETAVRGLA